MLTLQAVARSDIHVAAALGADSLLNTSPVCRSHSSNSAVAAHSPSDPGCVGGVDGSAGCADSEADTGHALITRPPSPPPGQDPSSSRKRKAESQPDNSRLLISTSTGNVGAATPTRPPFPLTEKMQAYPSVGSGHAVAAHAHNSSYSHLPAAAAAASGFYNAQSTPGYSTILQQPYGRNLKQNGQTSVAGLSSAAAAAGGYMPTAFPGTFASVPTGNNPYAAYGAAAYNAGAFSANPSCSSPGFSQQQALDYTYGSYGQNPAYAAYYSPANYPAYMHAAAAQAVQAVQASNTAAAAHNLTAPAAHSAANAGYQLAGLNTNSTAADSHYSTSNSNTTATPSPPLKENASVASLSKKARSSKNRGRRQNNPTPPPEGDMERVFIWNLDETIIVLISGVLQDPLPHPDLQNRALDCEFFRSICLRMETLIMQISEKCLFMEDLYECDQVHIDDVASDDNGQDLSSYNFAADGFRAISPNGNLCMASGVRGGVDWMRKLAFRYRRIKDIYNQYRTQPDVLCGHCGVSRQEWVTMREQIDSQTFNWSRLAHECLKKIATRDGCTNVLVTQNALVAAITKLLLFGFADVFPIENVYSSAKVGKETCFERILNRFGRKCTYVVVGSGHEEETAAKQMNFPFWRVECFNHLVALRHAINEQHL
ncbi:eyes absent homolog 1-like [Paramacrobiotus metropolitanus]|uniref:eyes absent homolog 1-like n=1 Tax=Paramacrobiotus metropolitanus TaxID=2943436 RepID=UPI00244630B4|nr:eyes absent homolog 1-like [Paramacrobiotus metropolitanus]